MSQAFLLSTLFSISSVREQYINTPRSCLLLDLHHPIFAIYENAERLAACVWTASVKKKLFPWHGDITLPFVQPKNTGARVYVVLPLFHPEKKTSLEVASSDSYNSASLRSVPFQIPRYYTGLGFT